MYYFEYQEIREELDRQKKINWWIISALIILFISIILFGCTFYYWQEKKIQNQKIYDMEMEKYKARGENFDNALKKEKQLKGLYDGTTTARQGNSQITNQRSDGKRNSANGD